MIQAVGPLMRERVGATVTGEVNHAQLGLIVRGKGSVPTRANGQRHAPAARFLPGDWMQANWSQGLGQFDLVLSNPPYVEDAADLAPSVRAHEPAQALFSGPDGLDDYRVLVPQIPALLEENGIALIEIGWTQAAAVSALAQGAGMSAKVHRDLALRERAVEMAKNRNIPLGKASPAL